MARIRRRVTVSGRVQGVFFRAETKKHADRFGLVGSVRNLADGRVEAVIEGEEQLVEQMLKFLRVGPSRAQVISLDVVEEEAVGKESGFSIRY